MGDLPVGWREERGVVFVSRKGLVDGRGQREGEGQGHGGGGSSWTVRISAAVRDIYLACSSEYCHFAVA